MKKLVSLLGATALYVTSVVSSHAAIILDGSQSLGVISLSESFEDFYGQSEVIINSSNTGYEQNNTGVFLIAEYLGEYALIATFGAFFSDGDNDGASLIIDITNNGVGSLDLVDDPSDTVTVSGSTTTIDFFYNPNRNDGFIFSLGDGTNADLLVEFSDIEGVDNFLFTDGVGNEYLLSNSFTLETSSVAVPEPPLMLILLGTLLLAFRKSAKY